MRKVVIVLILGLFLALATVATAFAVGKSYSAILTDPDGNYVGSAIVVDSTLVIEGSLVECEILKALIAILLIDIDGENIGPIPVDFCAFRGMISIDPRISVGDGSIVNGSDAAGVRLFSGRLNLNQGRGP